MRIITGIAKGKKLRAPEGLGTRPTADRVKQSLFNMLSGKLIEATVLDLFAGTGNLGLEAISQRASYCCFVEQDRKAYSILSQNIAELGFQKYSETHLGDALEYVARLGAKQKQFDLIFLDPPYGKSLIQIAITSILKHSLLSEDGIIISEYDIEDQIPERIGEIEMYRTVKYGRTKLSFWRRVEKE